MKGSQYAVIKLVETSDFVENVNRLIKPTKAKITVYDNWMPRSLHYDKEAELKDFLKYNFSNQLGEDIHDWWLAVKHTMSRTPNWDLVSTCTINDKKGLVLIEAKAHSGELDYESRGKNPKKLTSEDSVRNHIKIGAAIIEAKDEINKRIAGVNISRDLCYQLSNRVAHAWWLANQGIPVVLVYLGFLNCHDMDYNNRILFKNDEDWQTCFNEHAQKVGVDTIIGKWVNCGESKFITICRSY